MALRPPPGRAGRLWLLHRIDSGRRGGEVLDQKRQALLREEARLRGEAERAEAEWRERAAEAASWLRRAAVLGGERALGLACFYAGGSAEVELVWRNTLGVSHPAEARLSPGEEKAPFLGTPALVPAAEAHRSGARGRGPARRRARESPPGGRRAGAHGPAAAHDRAALAPGARRDALHELELRLDEEEREELARVRWTLGRDRRFAPERSIRRSSLVAALPAPPTPLVVGREERVGLVAVEDGARVQPGVRDRCADRIERHERGDAPDHVSRDGFRSFSERKSL